MNKKKEFVKILFTWLLDIRPWVNDVLSMIELRHIDEEFIDYLVDQIYETMNETDQELNKNRFEVIINSLDNIKKKEAKSKKQDEIDIENLLKNINKK